MAEKTLKEIEDLINRLEGLYPMGPHTPNGDPEFGWRQFEATPINMEAAAALRQLLATETFQARVYPWLMACFGEKYSGDKIERNHRFLEEALELVQSCGCSKDEAHQLVDYVYGRDQGETEQEIGGVMVTLAALCLAHGLNMHEAAETELARIWTVIEKIRAKQAAKPRNSPLPEFPS